MGDRFYATSYRLRSTKAGSATKRVIGISRIGNVRRQRPPLAALTLGIVRDDRGRGQNRQRPASVCPPVRLVYWQSHSFRRPTDHIQAAALALATGSKISWSA